jgi:HlyD family secretion protein
MSLRRWRRGAAAIALAAGLVSGLAWLAWPRPIPVETAPVERGEVTRLVREEGRTRIRERFTIASPLAGRLARITLDEGDRVRAGETILASIAPRDPSLLDPRAREEAEARVRAAEAEHGRAKAMLVHANALLESVEDELQRARRASDEGALSIQELERDESAAIVARAARDAAAFAVETARFGLELAQAALVRGDGDLAGWTLEVRSPADGVLLRKFHESETPVEPGTPLVEIGDTGDLELVVDCLSEDAVAIRPGDAASIVAWGGKRPLAARVRTVEPSAFTEISSLGVEEQRVNVVLDLLDPPDVRPGLGDAFRIEAEITVDRVANAVRAPSAALVPDGRAWGVFTVDRGRARWRPVEVGMRGEGLAEIARGLAPGETVVVYPPEGIADGVRVAPREATSSATARPSGTWSNRP